MQLCFLTAVWDTLFRKLNKNENAVVGFILNSPMNIDEQLVSTYLNYFVKLPFEGLDKVIHGSDFSVFVYGVNVFVLEETLYLVIIVFICTLSCRCVRILSDVRNLLSKIQTVA
jgi:hypothetical protein